MNWHKLENSLTYYLELLEFHAAEFDCAGNVRVYVSPNDQNKTWYISFRHQTLTGFTSLEQAQQAAEKEIPAYSEKLRHFQHLHHQYKALCRELKLPMDPYRD